MLGLPKLYWDNKEAILRDFDDKLANKPEFFSQDDRRALLNKYSVLNTKIQNSFGYGAALGLFAAWNMRALDNLSWPFKIFGALAPVVLFPAYYYFNEYPKIEAYKVFLYLKNNHYQLPSSKPAAPEDNKPKN